MTEPESGCSGKESFATWQFANRVATRMRRNDKKERCAVYRCSVCKQFHIGNATSPRRTVNV